MVPDRTFVLTVDWFSFFPLQENLFLSGLDWELYRASCSRLSPRMLLHSNHGPMSGTKGSSTTPMNEKAKMTVSFLSRTSLGCVVGTVGVTSCRPPNGLRQALLASRQGSTVTMRNIFFSKTSDQRRNTRRETEVACTKVLLINFLEWPTYCTSQYRQHIS